jgi:hypothetical protein
MAKAQEKVGGISVINEGQTISHSQNQALANRFSLKQAPLTASQSLALSLDRNEN